MLASRSTLLLALMAVALGALAPASAQGGKPADKPDPAKERSKAIQGHLAEMKKLVADKTGKKDGDAITQIDKLIEAFPEAAAADKKLISDAVAKNLTLERPPLGPNEEQHKLYQTSVVALGQMGELGSKHLMGAFEMKEWKRDARFRGRILTSIGSTKDANAVEFLIKVLNDKDDGIVADCSAAFGSYNTAKEDVRKKIVEKLVNLLNSSQSQAADPSTPQGKVAKDRYEKISPAIIESLQKLTNQTLRQPLEWQKWWNNNKQKPWT